MVFFLFFAAQSYSANEGVPVETISRLLRWRWKRVRKPGEPDTSGQTVNVGYSYFGLCLFSASVHTDENNSFFWGVCALLAWALWAQRSRRYAPVVWFACLATVIGLGYLGQRGLSHVQSFLGNLNIGLPFAGHRRQDPGQSRTDFGNIGLMKLSAAIVIRLEAQRGAAPPLLREASFRRFSGQTWFADLRDADYGVVPENPAVSGSYNLIPGKTNYSLKATIGCYLENGKGLLPLPTGAGRLENLSANLLTKSPLGAVLEDGPGVVVFDALYGPGYTLDSEPDLDQDLAVPSREAEALDRVITEVGLKPSASPPASAAGPSSPDPQPLSPGPPEQSLQEVLAAFNKHFANNFTYSVYQPILRSRRDRETPLSRFLSRTHRGHCEYFATAGVLLLRRMHIPARYAIGYAVHEGSGGKFVVRQRDAHAWCLVWDARRNTWRDIDFTPPSWLQVEAIDQGWFRSIADFFARIRFEISKFRWGQTHLRQYLLWGVIPILAVLLFQIIFQSRRRRQNAQKKSSRLPIAWPGLDSEFYRLETELVKRGLTRAPNEPLTSWAGRLPGDLGTTEIKEVLPEVLRLHYRYRFDPEGLSPSERDALRLRVAFCLESLGRAGRG